MTICVETFMGKTENSVVDMSLNFKPAERLHYIWKNFEVFVTAHAAEFRNWKCFKDDVGRFKSSELQ